MDSIKINALTEILALSNHLAPLIPYHINLLDFVRIDEPRHSKILHKIFEYRVGKEYPLLKSFLAYINKHHNQEFDFRHEIGQATITSETNRIDLLIRQKKEFAIIIENKIYDANDQNEQLITYIDRVKKVHQIATENIYVLYISRTGKQPEEHSFPGIGIEGEQRAKDFKSRYVELSFSEDIINWLKSTEVVELVDINPSLKNAISIYQEHLEKSINNNLNYNAMNTETREALTSELKLGESSQNDIIKINESIDKIDATRELLVELKMEKINSYFKSLKDQVDNYLKEVKTSPNTKLESFIDQDATFVEIQYNQNATSFALSVVYNIDEDSLIYGISTIGGREKKQNDKEYKLLKDILQEFDGEEEELWYCYKDTSFESAYEDVTNLADKVNKLLG